MKHIRTEQLGDGYRFAYDLSGAEHRSNEGEMPCMNSYFMDERNECPNSGEDWSNGQTPCPMQLDRYFTDEGWFTDLRCRKFGQQACYLTSVSVERRTEIALDQEWIPDAAEED